MKKKNIILIEDHQLYGKVLSLTLSPLYEITWVENPLLAIQWLAENQVDLIITDLHMPQMNGAEFIRWKLEQETLRDIPVMVISGIYSNQDRLVLDELGVDHFLAKPIKTVELLMTIEQIFDGR